jgi:hypothetical protein
VRTSIVQIRTAGKDLRIATQGIVRGNPAATVGPPPKQDAPAAGVLRLTFCGGEAASQRLVYLQWPCQPRQGCQHHHQHHPPSSWCHCTDGMLLGAGVRALATPGLSPRAEMASAPAMVASAIAFFAFIRKPLKRLFVFDGPCWVPRFRLTQTESARHPEG